VHPPTYVILANVHAFTANGQRNINTIVDQERDAMRFGNRVKLFGGADEVAGIARLVTILDN